MKCRVTAGVAAVGLSFGAVDVASAQPSLALEPAVGVVATVDGTVGPHLVVEGGYELRPIEQLYLVPMVRLGAGYMGEAAPLSAAIGLRPMLVLEPVVISIAGFGGIADGGGTASHGIQPYGGGGFAVDGEIGEQVRLGGQAMAGAAVGDKSAVWGSFGPRITFLFP